MSEFKLRFTALGCVSMLALAGAAIAQEAPADPVAVTTDEATEEAKTLDTVVVSGFRQSLANSAAVKRDSDLIVEAITAEDIGKLPDISIAESLARLPGLAIQRIDGRGQQLSIRGLGPDFNSAILNGREQVTTGDNRGVEFDQFPSELLSGVLVYKTPDATLIGQGLMGTVDLRTIRPLSQKDRVLAGGVRYEWNDQGALNAGSDDSGYRLNGIYVDQFANDTMGVAIGFATMSTPTQANIFNAWGYPNAADGNLVIGGSKPYAKSNDLDRTGIIGTFEFEPSATFRMSVDAFYSDFEENQILRGVELPLFWSAAQLQPGYTVENGLITEGVYTDVKGVVRNDINIREAELFSLGYNFQWIVGDAWTLTADLSTSMVDRTDTVLETYSGTGPNGVGATDTIGFTQSGDGYFVFNPTLNYGDPNLIRITSPQGWGGTDAAGSRPFGQAGYLNLPSIEDDLYALRLSAEREFELGMFTGVEFGMNYTTREKTKVANEFFLAVANGQPSAAIPSNLIVGTTDFSFVGLGPIIAYDPIALLNSGIVTLSTNADDDVVTKSWQVEEDVWTGFVKFDIDTMLAGNPLTGNIGMQVVYTDQSSTGGTIGENDEGAGFLTVTEGDTYTHYLPSLNLTWQLPADQYLRLGIARTLSRARMDDIRVSRTLNRDARYLTTNSTVPGQTYFSAGGGNPTLRPYVATGIDISYEKYFGDGGYVAAAAFYKDLDDWVYGGSFQSDFADFTYLLSPADQAALASTTGYVFGPVNLEGGYIQGIELSASVPLDMFSPALEGFGFTVSGSFTDSEIQPNPNDPPISVPGLSETVVNGTFYYERGGFSARVSNRYRDEFLGEVSGFGFSRTTRSVESESIFDAQIGFDFSGSDIDGDRLDGLTILFQGYNLTDEPFVTFNNGDPRQVIDYQEYGTTYLLGLSYKY